MPSNLTDCTDRPRLTLLALDGGLILRSMRRVALLIALPSLASVVPVSAQSVPATATGVVTTVAQLAGQLHDPALVVIHAARDTAAASGPQVPGARFLPMASYTETRNGLVAELPAVAQLDSLLESVGVSNASRVVIYGDPLAAARLFFTFDYLGLGSRVSLLDGGLPAWIAANHPTATVTRAVQRGVLTPSPQPQLIVDVAEMVARLGDTTVLRLDARPAAEFAGAPSEGITRAGHIPGARNVFWRDALTGAGGQFLKPVPELRALLSAAGVAPGKEIVTYCKTGIQASYLYFVVRYLGYTPRLYDGSYAEWSSDPSRAVERD